MPDINSLVRRVENSVNLVINGAMRDVDNGTLTDQPDDNVALEKIIGVVNRVVGDWSENLSGGRDHFDWISVPHTPDIIRCLHGGLREALRAYAPGDEEYTALSDAMLELSDEHRDLCGDELPE